MNTLLKHPVWVLLVIALITILSIIQIPRIRMDNDVFNFLPENSAPRLAIERTTELFGSSMPLVVDVRSERDTILSKEGMELVFRLTGAFEKVPDVLKVQSLENVDYVDGTADGIVVEPLVKDFDGSPESVRRLTEKLKSWDLYDRLLVSKDFRSTQIALEVDLGVDAVRKEAVYNAVTEILAKNPAKGFRYYIAGIPSVTILVNKNMRKDLSILIPFVTLTVLIVLFLSFRRLGGVILPIMTVLISTAWTIGLMAFLGFPLSILGTIIPVVMIAVGSAYGIHIISHYYDEIAGAGGGGGLDEAAHRAIVAKTLRVVGLPVFLAGFTTIIGFGSIAVSSVVPMRNFGIFTAIGVVMALVVAMVFIPAALLLRHRALKAAPDAGRQGPVIGYLVDRLSSAATIHKVPVLLLFASLSAAAAFFTTKLVVDNNMVEYFREDTEIRVSDNFIRKNFAGTIFFDIVVRGQKKGDLNDPRILAAMDGLKRHITDAHPQVAKVLSYSDFIKRINQVLHADTPGDFNPAPPAAAPADPGSFWVEEPEPAAASAAVAPADTDEGAPPLSAGQARATEALLAAYYRGGRTDMSAAELVASLARLVNYRGADYFEIPTDPAKYGLASETELKDLVSQYLLLYSGGLDEWADESLEPMVAKMTVQLDESGASFIRRLTPDIERWVKDWFPEGYTVELSGAALGQAALTEMIVSSAVWSMIVSIILVMATLAVSYRSAVAGLIGSIPLAVTVLINFGVMGLARIRLDISTAMVGSLAIGIGIDYSIHFMASYRRNYLALVNRDAATRAALRSTGKAIIFNAVSVAAGFLVLMFSQFNPVVFMGFLVALTMFTSSLAAMTLLPVLLNMFKPKFIARPERADAAAI
ncbi:MAG: MMPL family transporter [Spirochaetes bacterium]|nr:MMPL family transporter [Spirochaetota bacterium]